VPGAARNRTDTSICNPPATCRAFSRDDEAATRSVKGGGNRNTSARGPVCSRLVFAARSPDGVGTIANASGAAIALYLRNQQRSDRYLLSWAFAWIADLGTAEKTVKVHRARGLEKMQVRSVAELVRAVERLRGAQPVPVGTPACAKSTGRPRRPDYFRNSGEIRLGRKSTTCGQTTTSTSTPIIGISMIMVSFSASASRISAILQQIIRHRP
jgi:hypothetical protein